MQKLTLTVDDRVIRRAKQYANARGTSVSRLVETLLDLLAAPVADGSTPPPVLAKMRGSLVRETVTLTTTAAAHESGHP